MPASCASIGRLIRRVEVEADLLDVALWVVDARLVAGYGAALVPTGVVHIVARGWCAVQLKEGKIATRIVREQARPAHGLVRGAIGVAPADGAFPIETEHPCAHVQVAGQAMIGGKEVGRACL